MFDEYNRVVPTHTFKIGATTINSEVFVNLESRFHWIERENRGDKDLCVPELPEGMAKGDFEVEELFFVVDERLRLSDIRYTAAVQRVSWKVTFRVCFSVRF